MSGRDYVGHSEGVLIDDEGRVVAFVVRLSPDLAPGSPRTLVSAAAMTPTKDSHLLLAWSEDKLLEHPRLAEADPPAESAPPTPADRSIEADVNVKETLKEGVEGTAVGVALGAIVGLTVLAPAGVLALAVFFATGGAVLGAIAGASQGSPKKEGDDIGPQHQNPALQALEQRLRQPGLGTMGRVHTARFSGTAGPIDDPSKIPRPTGIPGYGESALGGSLDENHEGGTG